MIQTTDYIIPATVITTGKKVMVNNPPSDLPNPWGFYEDMWHFDQEGNVYHDDELNFD